MTSAPSLPATHIPFDQLVTALEKLLQEAGAAPQVARLIATNCAGCEREGTFRHGVFRIAGCLGSLRSGWVNGCSEPIVSNVSPSFLRIDAANGFAQPVLAAAKPLIDQAIEDIGVATVATRNDNHFSALWPDFEPFAEAGLVVSPW